MEIEVSVIVVCRVILEAKMMGLKTITNKLIGASYEEWYSLNGIELINEMRNKRKSLVDFIRGIKQSE